MLERMNASLMGQDKPKPPPKPPKEDVWIKRREEKRIPKDGKK